MSAPLRVLVAPDSFKGTFTAPQVAAAIGRGLEHGGLVPPNLCPVADGGEGTLAVLLTALGGETHGTTARDPLGRRDPAGFALVDGGGTAIVEVAEASGLHRVAPIERDAFAASSAGTGDLVAAAIDQGAHVVLVAAGGSATTDGGAGAIEAIEDAGGLRGAMLVVLTDVRTPFEDAARVFAPQKGADAATVERLTARLDAQALALPRDPRGVPGTGAAGGLAGGLWARYDAVLEPGAPFVLDQLDFDERLSLVDAVVVGEGRIDDQTRAGKVAGEISLRAARAGVPVHAIVGEDDLDAAGRAALGLRSVREASTLPALEAAGARLAALLLRER